jgi:hypothetical protein
MRMLDHVRTFVDGLSIPFFSVGRRTLTISRSLVIDKPTWLPWGRRDAPQVDTERSAHAGEDANSAVAEESRRKRQKQIESPLAGLSDMPDSAIEGVKTPEREVRIDVCTPFYLSYSPPEGTQN